MAVTLPRRSRLTTSGRSPSRWVNRSLNRNPNRNQIRPITTTARRFGQLERIRYIEVTRDTAGTSTETEMGWPVSRLLLILGVVLSILIALGVLAGIAYSWVQIAASI